MLNLLFKLSDLNSNFALTLGYFNPALNIPALYASLLYKNIKYYYYYYYYCYYYYYHYYYLF